MRTKELLAEAIEGKRANSVWKLILDSINKLYKEKTEESNLVEATNTYFRDCAEEIDKEDYKYIIVEQYNIEDDFYWRLYKEDEVDITDGKKNFAYIFEDYFSDDGEYSNSWNDVLVVDLKELKSYLVGKKLTFPTTEII